MVGETTELCDHGFLFLREHPVRIAFHVDDAGEFTFVDGQRYSADIAPPVMPEMMCFCTMKAKIATGITVTVPTAAI